MDRTAALFWGLIVLLLSASIFYGVNAEKQRRSTQSAGGKIENGDLVQLIKVVDGDTVMAARDGQEPVTVRLIGIKSFDGKIEKDVVTPFAQAARESLQRIMTGRSARVLLGSSPKDKYGRYLATLYSGDKDVALHLVSQGLVMVYTVYPFPAMQLYLQEQELARAGRRGLWASAEASERALALISEWQRQTQ